MSHPITAKLPFALIYEDGEPLESDWHSYQLPLLRHLIWRVMQERGKEDFHVGVNGFVYYSVEQARKVAEEEEKGGPKRAFRGPDVYWVGGVDPNRNRQIWISWEEDGRLPDVIFEMLSPSTAIKDRTENRDLYARVFRTAEYFLYEPETHQLEGLRLAGRFYQPIQPDENGRLWSEQLGAYVGLWNGSVCLPPRPALDWVRLFRADGSLVLTAEERADAERWRADAAESELARLRALLGERDRS